MRISVSSSTRWLIVALSVILVSCANAQSAKPTPNAQDALYQTVASLDTQLFNAVNQCDLKTLNALWADDAEFYHDKGGLMVGRLNGYGAVEIGVHRFYHPYEQDHGEVGEANFIHVWQNKDGAWKITRVISYDHGAAK